MRFITIAPEAAKAPNKSSLPTSSLRGLHSEPESMPRLLIQSVALGFTKTRCLSFHGNKIVLNFSNFVFPLSSKKKKRYNNLIPSSFIPSPIDTKQHLLPYNTSCPAATTKPKPNITIFSSKAAVGVLAPPVKATVGIVLEVEEGEDDDEEAGSEVDVRDGAWVGVRLGGGAVLVVVVDGDDRGKAEIDDALDEEVDADVGFG